MSAIGATTGVGDGAAADVMRTEGPTLRARGLECHFTGARSVVHALGPLDLSVARGEFISLVGPSGCGKSTFIKIVAGLLEPSAGELEIRFQHDRLSTIATVFQDFGIFPWMSVEQNIVFALKAKGVQRAAARERANDWLGRMGLAGFGDAFPATLSGGMRQRVAIARAFAMEPEILLMDEPFAALDAQLREMLQDELLSLCQSGDRTVVFVTHSLEEAVLLGDRVVVMTNRPARVLDDQAVPFARPRDPDIRNHSDFGAIRSKLWAHLRNEVAVAGSGRDV